MMTREEVFKAIEELKAKRNELFAEIKASMEIDKYRNKKVRCYREHTDWKTKLPAYEYVGDGYVVDFDMSSTFDPGGVYYMINKIKKDGSMAMSSAGYWHIGKVELIEE